VRKCFAGIYRPLLCWQDERTKGEWVKEADLASMVGRDSDVGSGNVALEHAVVFCSVACSYPIIGEEMF